MSWRFGKGSLTGARLLGPQESGSGVLNRDSDALGLRVSGVKAPPTQKWVRGVGIRGAEKAPLCGTVLRHEEPAGEA